MTVYSMLKVHALMTIMVFLSPLSSWGQQGLSQAPLRVGDPWTTEVLEIVYEEDHHEVNWGHYLGEFFNVPPVRFLVDASVQLKRIDSQTLNTVSRCEAVAGTWQTVACVMNGISENYDYKTNAFQVVRNLGFALKEMNIESLYLSNKYFGHGSHGHTALILIFKSRTDRIYSYYIDPVKLPGEIFPVSQDAIIFHDNNGDGVSENGELPEVD